MAKKKDNYLDYIPRPNTLFECNKNKDGKIEIKMHNKGVFNNCLLYTSDAADEL